MRRMLFFDIDGTLLAGGIPGYIPDSAMEALTQAQANGHYIFINSGRTYGFMPEAIKEFPFDGYVCGCGTEVIFHGETLYHYDLDDSLKRSLDDILTECKIQAVCEGRNSCYFQAKNDAEVFAPIITMHPYGFEEIVPKGCSKASGIDFIVKHLKASLDDCYVFGDSTNDLSMLTHVKNSIAMGNAYPEVLRNTSYVTTPIDRDGIRNALKHFKLI